MHVGDKVLVISERFAFWHSAMQEAEIIAVANGAAYKVRFKRRSYGVFTVEQWIGGKKVFKITEARGVTA
jgi:hypothetical protein